jgi:hypothetical protein
MFLVSSLNTGEGKPRVEAYAAGKLIASVEAVAPGLGALVGELAGLVSDLAGGGAASFDEIERHVMVRGRELLRMTAQHVLDELAAGEQRLAQVTDAAGVPRPRAERGHGRTVVSLCGPVTVRRMAYRAPGQPSLHPADAVLNLPVRRYSWQVQQAVVEYVLAGAYEQAQGFLRSATGITIGKQQLEQITAEAARDAAGFYPAMAAGRDLAGPDLAGMALAISADAKGVAMRPEARRRYYGRKGQRLKTFGKRLGTGEKAGHKRMAETGVVFDVRPPPGPPRTPEQVMTREPGQPARSPQARNRWYTVDITARGADTISALFDEAQRRDPGHARPWIALVDGDRHQIDVIGAQAAARGITITILVDFIHVLEYLWKAAWCFHAPRDPAAETWVTAQGLDILHGQVPQVISRIRALTAAHPPRPGSEHDKIIARTLTYLTAKTPYLDYPRALAAGWPIATGVIEGACRHLVNDRMGITGARWGLEGAQAILWLRAIRANGDLDTYWAYHIEQEHHRNHLSRYQPGLTLAA